jgi:hypothetical protein
MIENPVNVLYNIWERRFRMKKHIGVSVFAILGAIALMLVFTTKLSALVYLNTTEWGFESPKDSAMQTAAMGILNIFQGSNRDLIKYYIKEGAAFFFKSHASFSLFLSNVELVGLDNPDNKAVAPILDMTITEMRNAINMYERLVQTAKERDYDPDFNAKLKSFDYDEFREKKRLRKDVMEKVKSYLGKGDIRGIYDKVLFQCKNLLKASEDLKRKIDAKEDIFVSDIWDLSDHYTDSKTFGQYVSRVFFDIKGREGKNK